MATRTIGAALTTAGAGMLLAVLVASAGPRQALAADGRSGATGAAWADTATHAQASVGTRFAAAPKSQKLRLSIGLRARNYSALMSRAADRTSTVIAPAGSPGDFASTYAPSQVTVDAVTRYLASTGMTSISVDSNHLLVHAEATVAQADAAFNTTESLVFVDGQIRLVNDRPAQVPARLSGSVLGVLGLSDIVSFSPGPPGPHATPSLPASLVASRGPRDFWKAYDANPAPEASQTMVGVFAQGDLNVVRSDLAQATDKWQLATTPVTVIPVGPASTDTVNAPVFSLVTQYASGMAGHAGRLFLYDTTTLNASDMASAFNLYASQNVARVAVLPSVECEAQAYLDGSMLIDDQAFAQAALQGQSLFVATGDSGGFCPTGRGTAGVPAGIPDVQYPASSPYVIAVGGTTLATNPDGNYNSEMAWSQGGGGLSLFERQPAWQQGFAPPVAGGCDVQGAVCGGRAIPDIAMAADPSGGATVIVGGVETQGLGGTALSAALATGAWARLVTAKAKPLGFADRILYGAFHARLHDVVTGDNGPYPATTGFDLATGFGSFDEMALLAR